MVFKQILTLALVATLGLAKEGTTNWRTPTGSVNQYYYNTQGANWWTAGDQCRKLGLHLLSVESDQEFEFVRNWIQNLTGAYWTSGIDLIAKSSPDQGQFWAGNGEPIPAKYWGPQEPNDMSGSHEMCVNFWNWGKGYLLNDDDCPDKLGYLCKSREAAPAPPPCPTTTTPAQCPACPTTPKPTTCPPRICPTCPPPVTCSVVTHGPNPVESGEEVVLPFSCTTEGKSLDTVSCHKFHECVPYNGGFIDYEFNCPANLVFCPRTQNCEYNYDCPCNL